MLPVVRRDAQYRGGPGGLGASRGGCDQSGRLGEPARQRGQYTRCGPYRVKRGTLRCARLHLDLPINDDATRSTGRHRSLGGGEKTAQAGQQRDRRRNATRGGGQPAKAATEEPERPGRDHVAPWSSVGVWSRPSCIVHRTARRAATASSWVATIRAAPTLVAVSDRRLMTWSPLS